MSDNAKKGRKKEVRGGKRKGGREGGKKARIEISAGGIVYRRTPKGVRVALILDPFGKWTFAKGHVEEGETIRQAAVRETKEEMGLDEVSIKAPLGKIDFWFRDRYRPETRGILVHKYVHYFLMEADPGAKGRPQKKERIRRIIWVTPYRMMSQSSYKDVKSVIVKAKKMLDMKFKRRKRGGKREAGSGKISKG
ncbi:MAG: NUDIX domain-containing protein [Patescibacteria group bacterium]|nr:NUDIX domain-containing protein [Patescibacteria group bacterium]